LLTNFRLILEMIRFSHTLFALPFALWAAAMAWALGARSVPAVPFRWQDLLGILFCMVTARSAAMAANRIVDRSIDARNPRTAKRHLPAGLLRVGSVTLFAIASSAGFVASTLLFLPNRLPLYLSVPVLAFLVGYSYAKRFTSLAHVWLGVALMLAPISAWIAIRGDVVLQGPADLLPALVLGGAVLLWVCGFDVIYACQDVEFDVQQGLRSIPARWGVRPALRFAATCHAGMLVLLAALPAVCPALGLGTIYYAGLAAVAALLVYEHAIVRPDNLTKVNIAFFHVNTVVSLGLFAVGTLDTWL
jgi:4-hydroxybenzoate polyprenyltransferase